MRSFNDTLMDDDPNIRIEICWRSDRHPIDEQAIARVVRSVLDAETCGRADVSIAVVDDAEMADLHREHLGKSGPTDVLTFDLADGSSGPERGIDGEVVVSVETAARVAESAGHGGDAELFLYIAHGLLHLLGYDDTDPTQAVRMRQRQEALMASVGYPIGAV